MLQLLKNLMTELSFLNSHFTGKPVVTSQDVGCFLRLTKSQLHNILVGKISVFRVNIKQAKLQKRGKEHLHKTILGSVLLQS